ncbi:MAG: UDP-N-acetylmuramate:L-alanyl-gamma-D-glutamyl-meso-diaminopimelate ligase [Pseudomonadales bacterium]|nr:UDP-N-acetylmuramate:L-alanyl-gamma-D-glutamyl-meso-diaminopimelate ligase [Pseudomonadales bacterium]
MHIHILGICGTFMGSLAVLAKQLGHQVSGSDANVYPPMSTQLEAQGIALCQGYKPEHLQPAPDLVVVGNAMSRGNAAVEYALDSGLPYCSGPEFLARWVLKDRWVLGVAGTHGKTTTTSMLAWILEYAGLHPGYLIGGVAGNFPSSASLGEAPFFVVEADEYDTAFFDKRSKFIHYAPRTAILNNLEFDHGDIFEDLDAIKKQFHHLVRTVPSNGLILYSRGERHIEEVLAMGCWTPIQQTGVDVGREQCEQLAVTDGVFWNARILDAAGGRFQVEKFVNGEAGIQVSSEPVDWTMTGEHNVKNGLAALAAAHHAGVTLELGCAALCRFAGVRRRMELRGEVRGISVYDDFAHHPTAIATTLAGLAARLQEEPGASRLIAVIEPRSNTMRMGVHQDQLAQSTACADLVLWKRPQESGLDLDAVAAASSGAALVMNEVDAIVRYLVEQGRPGDHVVIMSNGGFEGIHQKLLDALKASGASRE